MAGGFISCYPIKSFGLRRKIYMNIYVCVGSSCHLKGSYNIVNLMREALKDNNLEDKVNLSASFCLGKCTDGVTMKIDDEIVCGVSNDNFYSVFSEHVLKKLGNQNERVFATKKGKL
jgi:NADH:ubiquinone oxidoreductase subunit E